MVHPKGRSGRPEERWDTARQGGGPHQRERGPVPTRARVGAVAHESWGASPAKRERVGGRCPRELGAVAHEERELGAVAHESWGPLPTKRERVGGRCPRRKGVRRGGDSSHDGREARGEGNRRSKREERRPVRADARWPREGDPLRERELPGGERTRVVIERPRIPAQTIRRSESSLSGRSPGTRSARLRSKNEAYVGAPGPSRRSGSPGHYRTNSTEGALRS